MSCCPSDAWGQLDPKDYTPKGTIETVEDLDIYRVGEGEKTIIWNYDIFGINAGRTKLLADLFASKGYQVLIPDYYRKGEGRNPFVDKDLMEFIKARTIWDNLQKDWLEKIRPYAEKHGAKRFGAIGTCWGTYMVLKLGGLPDVFAGVSWHPSHAPIAKNMLGEDLKELFASITAPQLFMPAGGDAPEDMADGLAKEVMGDKLKVVECLDMKHGWTTRGDISDPNTKRDLDLAIKEALDHFGKYL